MKNNIQLPALGSPIDVPWECPSWCTVDHATDGYTRHGHIIHRAVLELSPSSQACFWHVEVGTWRPAPDEVVELHMPLLSMDFKSGDSLRAHAAGLLTAAKLLDEMNAESMRGALVKVVKPS
jgi:hypothetical protein